MHLYISVFCLSLVSVVICASPVDLYHGGTNSSDFYKKYMELDEEILQLVGRGVKSFLPTLIETSNKLNLSPSCMRNTFTVIQGIRKLKMWALRFLDANPKPPAGFLRGAGIIPGDFDECLKTTVPKRDGSVDFYGKYCLINFKPVLPELQGIANMDEGIKEFKHAVQNGSDFIRFLAEISYAFQVVDGKLGLCVPSGCTEGDVAKIVSYVGSQALIDARVDSCQLESEQGHLQTRDIVTILGICSFGAFGIFASAVEYYLKKRPGAKKNLATRIIICFSISRNFRKLADTRSSYPALSSIHGLRVLTLFYIILAHQYFVILMIPSTRNAVDMSDFIKRFFSQIVLNGFLCVEVFMFMAGFLHSYLRTNRELDGSVSDRSPGYFKIMLVRIIRLAPLYIVCSLWFFLMNARGPYSAELKRKYWKSCEDNWWWNLLFIHNFFNLEETCMEQTWYLSADMQVFVLALLPVGYLIRKEKAGVWLNSSLIVAGLVITIVWCWILDSPPSTIIFAPNREQFLQYALMYTMPFCHIAPYFTGVLLGFFLAKYKEIKIPKVYQVIGWPVAFLLSTSMLFVTYRWNNGSPFDRLESSLYFGFSKLVYVLGIGWMVFCCVTGHGGIINYILSLKMWVPISRLSYAVYLVSPIMQGFYRVNGRYLDDAHEMHVIWRHLGDIFISCLMAFPLVIIFESPLIAIQKLLLPIEDAKQAKGENRPVEGVENGGFRNGEVSLFVIEKNEKNIVSHI